MLYLKVLIRVCAHLQMIAKYWSIFKNTIKYSINYEPQVPLMDIWPILGVEAW